LKRIAAPAADRKELARQLHSDVAALRQLTDQLSPARGEETNYRPREFGEQPALLRIHSCAESKASL
jgi:hypothetical protein